MRPSIQTVSKALAKSKKLAFFAEVPRFSFNEAGQLRGRSVFGSKSKLLTPHQSAHVYFM
jgi:hypothetical protein